MLIELKALMQKLYVLTRKDLTKSQQAVQAGHAVVEYLLRGPLTSWANGTLVYLGVKNEEELLSRGQEISNCVEFREPDLDNELTSIAVVSDGRQFRELKLL